MPAPQAAAPASTTAPSSTSTASEAGVAGAGAGAGGIFQQAKDYLEQVDKTARPYIEMAHASAMAKGQEIKDYLEGKGQQDQHKDHPERHRTQTEGNMLGVGGAGVADKPAGSGEPGTYPAAPQQSVGHKALGMLDYGLVSVKSVLDAIGQKAETVGTHTTAAKDLAVEQPKGGVATGAGASAAGAGAATGVTAAAAKSASQAAAVPATTTAAPAAPAADQHPVKTTTNMVPHNSEEGDPVAADQHPVKTTTNTVPHNSEEGDPVAADQHPVKTTTNTVPHNINNNLPFPRRPSSDIAAQQNLLPPHSGPTTAPVLHRLALRLTSPLKPETETVDCSRVKSHSIFHTST
ncbi:hypothetical protein CspeluHIS016_0801750 [Cutaneotrichosporon spelunceum]|uniref:Uncharacterized protein n=1 Tax=Cutaneotrichosporon spelunceum TaxID=1672016 RepID=A0AAD3TZS9_9TREE|nr:hypothetical protein CspeluHIS016_0801750 [Cutaneotrichosporon spelunceum]